MFARTSELLVLLAVLSASWAGSLCLAQEARAVAPARYHFGDDIRWADPSFDESAWPVAQRGRWPMPALSADGLMWVRSRVPVRSDAAGPLSIRLLNGGYTLAAEIFVNGVSVGQQGSFPPHVWYTRETVFDLPAGLTAPGTDALVAFRVWYPPIAHESASVWEGDWAPHAFASVAFDIDESRSLHPINRADHVTALLQAGPDLALNIIIGMLGVGLLVLWRWVGGRELWLCWGLLISFPAFSLLNAAISLGILTRPWWVYSLLSAALQFINMSIWIEFIWSIHDLRAVALKRVAQACIVTFNAADLMMRLATTPSPFMEWSFLVLRPAFACFSGISLLVNLWVLFFRRSNRLIAAAAAFIMVTALLTRFGMITGFAVGQFHESYFGLAYFLFELTLFVLLGQRAWKAWRDGNDLRVEFEAAREVQQHLVAPAVDVPGFKIESVYAPAKQVGGDFFRVLPEADGSVLVVVGDVSGKGLKAAMTVSAIMGSLRGYPSRRPAEILAYLNRVLYGQIGGFVTCCVSLIAGDGTMILANAGNPAPYRNGAEMTVLSGLPLGMLAESHYEETSYQISPGDRLVFVSDGVVEATGPSGELYGFERTQAISNQSTKSIADAATQFGQEDDITVLSVTRVAGLNPALAQMEKQGNCQYT